MKTTLLHFIIAPIGFILINLLILLQTEQAQFSSLLDSSTRSDRARLMSVTSPQAAAWISVTPSIGQGLHLLSNEFQVAIQWWLGINSGWNSDSLPLGGDVTTRHNAMRNVLHTTFHHAGLSAYLEQGSSWRNDKSRSRPADILVANWDRGFFSSFQCLGDVPA